MFTPGQVSSMLEIPPSTLWRYCKQFSEHLSESANLKRGKRYTENDIEILSRIRELFAQGRSPGEVAELVKQIVISSDNELAPDSALALVPSISKALTETLAVSQALRSEVSDLQEQQTSTHSRVDALEAWARSPWWQRLFGKPPE